jgi:hypothetical protein
MKSEKSGDWKEAMKVEMKQLEDTGTWKLVDDSIVLRG